MRLNILSCEMRQCTLTLLWTKNLVRLVIVFDLCVRYWVAPSSHKQHDYIPITTLWSRVRASHAESRDSGDIKTYRISNYIERTLSLRAQSTISHELARFWDFMRPSAISPQLISGIFLIKCNIFLLFYCTQYQRKTRSGSRRWMWYCYKYHVDQYHMDLALSVV